MALRVNWRWKGSGRGMPALIKTRIVACGVFEDVLGHLELTRRYPGVQISYLPANLHTRPAQLEQRLAVELGGSPRGNERTICLYGECCPNINELCEQHGAIKVPGEHCYQMLLGGRRFAELMAETAGTYFVEKQLIVNFREHCVEPLELDDEEMRKCFFQHYSRLLYVRQPWDPELVPRAAELAEFLEMGLQVEDADYSCLDAVLKDLIEGESGR